MEDDEIAAKIASECHSDDWEADHERADGLLLAALNHLGYEKTVQAWLTVGKWYA